MDEDEKLKEFLETLEDFHAELWTHFDPTMTRGDKDQPRKIKQILKRMRKFAKKNGHVFESWEDER